MRIPDYRFTAPIKDQNYWTAKKNRVDKIREEEFGKELEEAVYQKESEAKKKNVESVTHVWHFLHHEIEDRSSRT